MRLYSLDRELEKEEVDFIAQVLRLSEPIKQVRIPHVLPLPEPTGLYRERPIIDKQMIEKHLLKAGIRSDYGKQVFLVVPKSAHWYWSLLAAVTKLTSRYPCLIETERYRGGNINNPGNIRILDMEELIGRGKAGV